MQPDTVVIVEDDPVAKLIAVDLLQDAGLVVAPFSNADEALSYMHENSPFVSAIFSDIQMPGQMDGLVLAEIVARHWPSVRVILTSGRLRPLDGALPPNAQFIQKPWSARTLLSSVKGETAHPSGL